VLEGIAFGILVVAWSAGISFLIMRKHTGDGWGGLAYFSAFFSGFAIATALLLVLAAISSSHEELKLLADGFEVTATIAIVFGSNCGPWESSVFVRRHPASGRVASRNGHTVVDITGLRKGHREMITLEMSGPEWQTLRAVREVLLDPLGPHRLPGELFDAPAPSASADDARSSGWNDGWISVTGRRRDTGEIATITVPRKQWINLTPLKWAAEEALRHQSGEPQKLRNSWPSRIAANVGLLVYALLCLTAVWGLIRLLDYLWHLF
jgi:hypothetical protein